MQGGQKKDDHFSKVWVDGSSVITGTTNTRKQFILQGSFQVFKTRNYPWCFHNPLLLSLLTLLSSQKGRERAPLATASWLKLFSPIPRASPSSELVEGEGKKRGDGGTEWGCMAKELAEEPFIGNRNSGYIHHPSTPQQCAVLLLKNLK